MKVPLVEVQGCHAQMGQEWQGQGQGQGGQAMGRGVRMAQMQPDDLQLDKPSPRGFLPASGEQVHVCHTALS